jgi:hypothetical protein
LRSLLLVVLLSGCNAILGIDPPTLLEDGGVTPDATAGDARISPDGPDLPDGAPTPDAAAGITDAPLGPDALPPCTEGDSRVTSADGTCYFRFGSTMTWHQSQDRCTNAGAHLVTITTQAESDVIATLLGGTDIWIGLSDEMNEGTFTWVTGELLMYTNWDSTEPNGSGDCVVIRQGGGRWWLDRLCTEGNASICER